MGKEKCYICKKVFDLNDEPNSGSLVQKGWAKDYSLCGNCFTKVEIYIEELAKEN